MLTSILRRIQPMVRRVEQAICCRETDRAKPDPGACHSSAPRSSGCISLEGKPPCTGRGLGGSLQGTCARGHMRGHLSGLPAEVRPVSVPAVPPSRPAPSSSTKHTLSASMTTTTSYEFQVTKGLR